MQQKPVNNKEHVHPSLPIIQKKKLKIEFSENT